MRQPYIIYRRQQSGGRIYQVAFWDESRNRYGLRRSVSSLIRELGERARHLSPTTRAGADAAARMFLELGLPYSSGDNLYTYLEHFWDAEGEHARISAGAGKPLSAAYLTANKHAIAKYVLPWLIETKRKRLRLSQVTAGLLEELKLHLQGQVSRGRQISARRVNGILQAVTVALAEAKRMGKIQANPAASIRRLREQKSTRHILTLQEATKLFARDWPEPRQKAINMLAAFTGMRLGECLGLQTDDIQRREIQLGEKTVGYWAIDLRHNWQAGEGLKGPKGGSYGELPIPDKFAGVLLRMTQENPWRSGFVFYGSLRDKPMHGRGVSEAYREVIHAIGISEAERLERRLTFHAWRHWYNSMIRAQGKLPDYALRQLTRHKAEAMTERYTDILPEQRELQRQAVAKIAEGLLASE